MTQFNIQISLFVSVIQNMEQVDQQNLLTDNQTALVLLPASLFAEITRPTVGIFYTLYATPTLFPLRSREDEERGVRGVVRSPVLAVSVGVGLMFNNVSPPVELHLRLSAQGNKVWKSHPF